MRNAFKVCSDNPKERDYFEDLSLDGIVDWIHVVVGRVQWEHLVNTVMNLDFTNTGRGRGELFAFLSEHSLLKGSVLWRVSLKNGVRSWIMIK